MLQRRYQRNLLVDALSLKAYIKYAGATACIDVWCYEGVPAAAIELDERL